MDNKYLERLLSRFPEELGFVTDQHDPLNIAMQNSSIIFDTTDDIMNRKMNDIFIGKINPTIASMYYYLEATFFDAPLSDNSYRDVNITKDYDREGTAQVVSNAADFKSMKITGIGYPNPDNSSEFIIPSGIVPSGMVLDTLVGLTYGFDWEESCWYVTTGDGAILEIDESLENVQTTTNTRFFRQEYASTNTDEYINIFRAPVYFQKEWTRVGGVFPELSMSYFPDTDTPLTGFSKINGVKIYAIIGNDVYSFDNTEFEVNMISNGLFEIKLFELNNPLWPETIELEIKYNVLGADLDNETIGNVNILNIYDIDKNTGQGRELQQADFSDLENPEDGDYVVYGNKIIYFRNDGISHYKMIFPAQFDGIDSETYEAAFPSGILSGDETYDYGYNSAYVVEYDVENSEYATYLSPAERANDLGTKNLPLF